MPSLYLVVFVPSGRNEVTFIGSDVDNEIVEDDVLPVNQKPTKSGMFWGLKTKIPCIHAEYAGD